MQGGAECGYCLRVVSHVMCLAGLWLGPFLTQPAVPGCNFVKTPSLRGSRGWGTVHFVSVECLGLVKLPMPAAKAGLRKTLMQLLLRQRWLLAELDQQALCCSAQRTPSQMQPQGTGLPHCSGSSLATSLQLPYSRQSPGLNILPISCYA